MKIVFLSFYSGVVYRGVETFVHQLSNSLVELGHKVIVYQLGQELPRAKYQTVSIPIRVDWEQRLLQAARKLLRLKSERVY